MNIFAFNRAVRDAELPAPVKVLLYTLATYYTPTGSIWPSVATLAKACCVTPRSLQRHLRMSQIAGWIEREERHGKTPVYTLLIPLTPDTSVTPVTHDTPDTSVTPPLTPVSPEETREETREKERENRIRDPGEGRTYAREQGASFSPLSSPPVETREDPPEAQGDTPQPPTPPELPETPATQPAWMRAPDPLRAMMAERQRRFRPKSLADREAEWAAMTPEQQAEALERVRLSVVGQGSKEVVA